MDLQRYIRDSRRLSCIVALREARVRRNLQRSDSAAVTGIDASTCRMLQAENVFDLEDWNGFSYPGYAI